MRQLKRFTLANSVVAILLLLAFALLSFDRFHAVALSDTQTDLEECMLTFRELLSHKGAGFSLADGRLLAGNYVINGNFEVPDKLQEIFGETATVFMGDVRVSTNVRREDGNRAVGTRLEGPAHNAVFTQGKAFRGETSILGVPYFTAYDPLRDNGGQVIGALYVGLKKSEFLSHYAKLKTEMTLILSGLIVVSTVFMILFGMLLKKAESAHEADHRFLQTLIDTIPNPVLFKDMQGRYLGGNRAFAEFRGVPIEQLLGRTVFDSLPQQQAAAINNAELEFMQKQSPRAEETEMIYADGSVRDVMIFRAVFPAADGSAGGMIGTVIDITGRKRAEAERERLISELQEALARVKTLSGLIPICSGCKQIRDDNGYWNQLESYISQHSDALFSHGYCPDCFAGASAELAVLKQEKQKNDPPSGTSPP